MVSVGECQRALTMLRAALSAEPGVRRPTSTVLQRSCGGFSSIPSALLKLSWALVAKI